MNKKRFVIILAGGEGKRMQKKLPKQFLLLNGAPVLMFTLNAFATLNCDIVVALHPQYHDFWDELLEKHHCTIRHLVVSGGETRFESVCNALNALPDEGWVAVHDAVRPLVKPTFVERCFQVAEKKGCAVPVLPITDSLRTGTYENNQATDRNLFYRVQTPQIFDCQTLKKAYQQPYQTSFTDDASVVEADSNPIFLTEGDLWNIKITHPTDFAIAQTYLVSMKENKE